jgi:hypothetical protein
MELIIMTYSPLLIRSSSFIFQNWNEHNNKMEINTCPKCNSRLWGVERYSAPKKLFYLICSDCQYSEVKEWVYQNPNQE